MVFSAYLSTLPSLSTFNVVTTISIAAIGVLAVIFLFFLVRLAFQYKKLKAKYVLLEIKPSAHAETTNISNKKLLEIFHSLHAPQLLLDKLLGIKQYVSFEIIGTSEKGIRFVARVPEDFQASVKKSLLSYLPSIEISEIDDYFAQIDGTNKIIEYTLSKSFIFPLVFQPDTDKLDSLAYLTGYLTKLQPNELITIQFVSSPVHNRTHSGISDTIHKIKTNLLKGIDLEEIVSRNARISVLDFVGRLGAFIILLPVTFIAWVFTSSKIPTPSWLFDSTDTSKKSTSFFSKELTRSVQEKISQPLYEVHVRVTVKTQGDSKARSQSIKSYFESFGTLFQGFKIDKNIFWYLHAPLLQKIHLKIAQLRLPFFNQPSILSATELSNLFHIPSPSSVQTEDLVKTKSPKLPAPLSLKQNSSHFDITFAYNEYGESTVPIGLTLEERRRHAYIIGATGTGKTTLLTHMIHQDMEKGNGLAVIDPHGDLAEKLLGVVPEHRKEDVVYFNPYDIEFPIGLNVLDIPKGLSEVELQREKDFITSTLISIFHKLYDARYSGPRMEHILRNVILTALEQEKPTLFTIYDLLTNVKYRKKVTGNLKDEILKSFWKNEFEKLGSFQKAEQISPITNKLGRFLTTSMTRNILNQSDSKLDFEDIMNNKKILICNLSKGKIGEDTAYFLGGLFTAKIQLTALRRVHIPEEKRPDFFLYIDEFQNFATMSFAQILSEARKYRLSVILAHQNTVQIEKDLLETIIGNTGTLICFRTTSPMDEVKLLPVFSPEIQKGQIPNLPSYNFYMKINALQPQSAFSGYIEDFIQKSNSAVHEFVIEHSRDKFAMKIERSFLSNKIDSKTDTESQEKIMPKPAKNSGVNVFEQVKKTP